jgi:hypothetical protein
VRNVFEEEEEVEKEEEDSNALSWVLCAAANKDEGQEGGTKEKRKNVHKTNSRGRSTMLFNCKICLLELLVCEKARIEGVSRKPGNAPGIFAPLIYLSFFYVADTSGRTSNVSIRSTSHSLSFPFCSN